MSVAEVREYLKKWDKDKDIIEFEESTATVELAAEALGTTPERIAKTISLYNKEKTHAIMVVVAGDAKVDNAKFKSEFGFRAKMLAGEDVATMTGHMVGGVCPFAVCDFAEIYLDDSLKRFETVFPACGSSNSCIEMTIQELEQCAAPSRWVDVCKDWIGQ